MSSAAAATEDIKDSICEAGHQAGRGLTLATGKVRRFFVWKISSD